jgi:hypothetical protein
LWKKKRGRGGTRARSGTPSDDANLISANVLSALKYYVKRRKSCIDQILFGNRNLLWSCSFRHSDKEKGQCNIEDDQYPNLDWIKELDIGQNIAKMITMDVKK